MKKPTAISRLSLKFGDIVVVPFPYADKLAEKRRPALVVSSTAFNARQSLVWVVMITSADNKGWIDDVEFPLKGTGLSSPSVIRTSKIATIERSRIDRVSGKIDNNTSRTVSLTVSTIFGTSFPHP
jgi:mRNA interferase MazF